MPHPPNPRPLAGEVGAARRERVPHTASSRHASGRKNIRRIGQFLRKQPARHRLILPEKANTCYGTWQFTVGWEMSTDYAPGFHVAAGQAVDPSAYDRWTGRWSRLFIPSLLRAAHVSPGSRVLDVSTGTGEAALMTLPLVGPSGLVIGADIAPQMLDAARVRLNAPSFLPVAADGQALPFRHGAFDAVLCQLGLQFFANPAQGLQEFRRVLRPGAWAAVCVISTPDRAPMWGILADALSRVLPARRSVLYLSFALADQGRLEALLAGAGFHDVRVERETHADIAETFDEYWAPIEAGVGSIPQTYLALAPADRRSVREQVRSRLARFEIAGKLSMSVEMLIGRGRA
jgi:ubiquinone/menaquinone biosynthesis C-methylase UbiE